MAESSTQRKSPPGPTKVLREDAAFRKLQRTFGEDLRHRREALGWTQQHAAEMLGLSWRHVQDIEAGEVNITLLLLYRYSVVFGFEVAALFSGTGRQG